MSGEMKPGNRGTPGYPVPPTLKANPNSIPESSVRWPNPIEGGKIPTRDVEPGVFYHGSSDEWTTPNGPISLTSTEKHAMVYARGHGSGNNPHVKAFRTKKIPNVIEIPSMAEKDNFDSAVFWLNDKSNSDAFYGLGTQSPGQDAWKKIERLGYNGVYFHEVDSGGDELLIFDPPKFIEKTMKESSEKDPRKGPDIGFGFNLEGFPLQDKYEFQSLPISVENKKGSVRKWYDPDGKEKGSTKMYCDYGYVDGSVGSDGEDVDVYVGKDEDAEFVYVVHQNKAPEFEKYDEDKVMLGFSSDDKARKAYLKQYNDDRFFGGMSSMPIEKFVEKVRAASGKKITNESKHKLNESTAEVWYHGSQWPRSAIKQGDDTFDNVKPPVFFTKEKNVAKEYSLHDIGAGAARNNRSGEKKSPTVYTVEVRPTKVFDLRKKECQQVYELIRNENPDKEMRLPRLDSEGFIMSRTRLPSFGPALTILNLIKNHGYDSALFDEGTQGISLAFNDVRGKTKIIETESLNKQESRLQESTNDTWYHGSPYTGIEGNFDKVKAPIYFTKFKGTAYQYAAGGIIGLAQQNLGNYKKSPTLYTVEIRPNKVLDLRKPECQQDYDEVRKNNPDQELKSRKVPEGSFISGRSGLPFNGTETIYMRLLSQQPYGYDAVILDEPNNETSLALFDPKGKTKILSADSVGRQNEGKSIKHLDDLPESRFIPILKALSEGKLEITEKLDGSARMSFGVHEGKIWTQSKSGPRRYESKAYPNKSQFKALRAAHEALESNAKGIIGAWDSDVSEMVAEVLYTKIPNSIEYGPNAIVVHGVVWDPSIKYGGHVVGPPREFVVRKLDLLEGWRLDFRPEVRLDPAPFKVLYSNIGTLPLSYIQAETRNRILKHVYEMKSAYGTQKGLVEGLVLRDRASGDMTKVVDRNLFTNLNKFFWRFRESLERGVMVEGKWQTGVMAGFRKKLAEEVLEAAGLRNPKLVQKVKENKKATLDETLLSMIHKKGITMKSFDSAISEGQAQLKALIAEWRVHVSMQPSLVLVSEDGSFSRNVSMHELVIERTERAFNEALEYFDEMRRIGDEIKENKARLIMAAKVVLGPNMLEKLQQLFEEPVWPDNKPHLPVTAIPKNREERASDVNSVLKNNVELLRRRGIIVGSSLGQGHHGVAYDAMFHGKKVVFKLTDDKSEANASFNLIGKKFKHVVTIYDSFKFKSGTFFGIVLEKLSPMNAKEEEYFDQFSKVLHFCKPYGELFTGDFDKVIGAVDDMLGVTHPKTLILFKKLAEGFDVVEMVAELAKANIQFMDYHKKNVMKRGSDYVVLDLGRSHSPAANVPVLESIMKQITESPDQIGVTLGRFQPFHKGHAAIVRELCKKYSKVIVLMAGNKRDEKNPFSFELRSEMMEKSLPDVFSKVELHRAEFDGKSSGYIPGILSNIARDKKSAIDSKTAFEILVGEDRVSEIQKQMSSALKNASKLSFDPSLALVKSLPGVTNDDDMGRISGTTLRKAILAGDKESAKKLVDPHLISNPADFESLFVRMTKELKGNDVAESLLRSIVEDLTLIGGVQGTKNILKRNEQKLLALKHVVVDSLKELGKGEAGVAFQIDGNRVLKVTTDLEEAQASIRVMGKNKQNVVKIFDVFHFPETQVFGIIEELLTPLSSDEIKEFDELRENLLAVFGETAPGKSPLYEFIEKGDWREFQKQLQIALARSIREDLSYPAGSAIDQRKEDRLKKTLDANMKRYTDVLTKYSVPGMMQDLRALDIKFSDYHGGNIMKRGGHYVINDLGGAVSPRTSIPMLESIVQNIVSEIGSFTGMGDTQTGVRGGSSSWSKAKPLSTASGSLDGQWQDQLRGLPKLK